MDQKKTYPASSMAAFVLFSLFGIFMFFVPVTIAGNNTIHIDHLVTFIKKIPHLERVYALLIVIIGAFLPFIRKNWNSMQVPLFSQC